MAMQLLSKSAHALMTSAPEEIQPLQELSVSYLRQVTRRSELIDQNQELMLGKLIAGGNTQAKEELVKANLRLVVSIARQVNNRQNIQGNLMDLIQEGNIGLLKAAEKFDYRRGNKFSTYAMWWIKQSIFQAAADQERPIRLPAHVLDSLSKLKKARAQFQERHQRQASDEELSVLLKMSVKKVQHLSRMANKTLSLESEMTMKDGNTQTLCDTLEDDRFGTPEAELAKQEAMANLQRAMTELLNPREQEILMLRFGLNTPDHKKLTLEEVGKRYDVTRECIRQTEIRALAKLRHSDYLRHLSGD